jgi:transcriptional regulator with XRE-family HTH domain
MKKPGLLAAQADPCQTVGQRISVLRNQRDMTQDGLALACGVSRSAVAQWETDRAGQLRGNITRIAEALDTTVEFLLNGGEARHTGDELAMLRLYRACAAEDRSFLLRTARKLACQPAGPPAAAAANAPRAARPKLHAAKTVKHRA